MPPIPESAQAAELLSSAADALLAGDMASAEQDIRAADFRSLRNYSYLLCGPISLAIHRQAHYPKYPPIQTRDTARMPSRSDERRVYARDGYRCRYCSSRVVLKEARNAFRAAFPSTARWGRTNEEKHFGLATLTASLDHVHPFRRGGTNDEQNLVTACGPCQFGRVHWTLEEVEIDDPRSFAPVVDGWDGLGRLQVKKLA